MKYVTCYGALWRLTEAQWKWYLTQVAKGKSTETMLPGTQLTTELVNITGIDDVEAQHLLDSPNDHRDPTQPEWHMTTQHGGLTQ